MPSKYDDATKSKAVRLVVEHRDEYDSEYGCIRAVAARIGVGPETLRKWVRQAEIDSGDRDGVSTATARENRELRRKVSELERTVESSRRQRVSSCGRATRDRGDLPVHRRAQSSVRSRSDLLHPVRAWVCDRSENLLRLA